MEVKEQNFIQKGRKVFEIEAQAISNLASRLSIDFEKACKMLLNCQGRVVVIGMGKSGHIGSKIAATLASTGTPAFFIHPGEASHGDLGMMKHEDIVIALSYSGETQEMLTLIPALKRSGIPFIAMTGNSKSTLAQNAEIHLDVHVEKEACALGLAPTSSTTAMLTMGDALAITLLETRGFSKEDFALSHPGGSLGKRLLLTIDNVMHQGHDIPAVTLQATLQDALIEMTRTRLGATAIVDENSKVLGIFTDGDLRRAFEQRIDLETPIERIMRTQCTTVGPTLLAAEALRIMETKKFNALLVVDDSNTLIGALNMHDLLRAGIL